MSALDAMGRRLRSPRLPGVDVVSPASMSPASMAMGRRLRLRPGPAVSGLGPRDRSRTPRSDTGATRTSTWRRQLSKPRVSGRTRSCIGCPGGGGIPKTAFMSLTLFSTPTKVGVPGPADSVILPARGARKPPWGDRR